MPDQIDQVLNVDNAFNKVVKWLQLDQTLALSSEEIAKLKVSFQKAVDHKTGFMVASSHTNTVLVSDQLAVCIDGAYEREALLKKYKGQASVRDCINRAGFFLFDRKHKDEDSRKGTEWAMQMLYEAAIIAPDRKLKFV